MKARLILLPLVALFVMTAASTVFAQFGEPSVKIGIARIQHYDPEYIHDDGTLPSKVTKEMKGAELFFEYILYERFGLEMNYTLTPLSRTYDLGVISDNVEETVSYFLYGANYYWANKANKKGSAFLLGISTGKATVSHSFEGGTLGKQSTTNSPTILVTKLGWDYNFDFGGARFQYQLVEGQDSNTTEITGVRQTVNLDSNAFLLGVFAFF